MSEVSLKKQFLTTKSGWTMVVTVVRISVTRLVIMLVTENLLMKLMLYVKNCSTVSDASRKLMIVALQISRTSGSSKVKKSFAVSFSFFESTKLL